MLILDKRKKAPPQSKGRGGVGARNRLGGQRGGGPGIQGGSEGEGAIIIILNFLQ